MHDLETRLDISINFDSPEYSELLSMLEQHGVENIFSEKVVLSAYTGILMCDMSEVHKYIEKLLGRSVWTHELASETLWKTIKEKAKSDFLKIIEL